YALQTAVGRLDSLSPLAVLGRGYSLTRTPAGDIVHSPAQVRVGDVIRVLLQRGSLDARVTQTRGQDDRPQVWRLAGAARADRGPAGDGESFAGGVAEDLRGGDRAGAQLYPLSRGRRKAHRGARQGRQRRARRTPVRPGTRARSVSAFDLDAYLK